VGVWREGSEDEEFILKEEVEETRIILYICTGTQQTLQLSSFNSP
jgi:hypothetical protein